MKINKNILFNIILIITGLISLLIVLDYILGFTPHDYFYEQNPGISFYVGVNVVSRWATFSYFTYHTMILFGIWAFLFGISNLFKLEKLNNFLRYKSIVVFIFTNYLITTLLYTIFELTSGNITFGLYALNFKAIKNFITNIIGHYVLFIVMLLIFIKVRTNSNENDHKHYLFMSLYIFIYYLYVLATGKFMYQIEWYPYPIFDTYSLFGTRLDIIVELIILFIISVILSVSYYFVIKLITKLKNNLLLKR